MNASQINLKDKGTDAAISTTINNMVRRTIDDTKKGNKPTQGKKLKFTISHCIIFFFHSDP